MLYIFNMDQGRMLTFDMSIALDTVQSLKLAIERHHAIPAGTQVLLVSGGETLESSNRVCSYSAGTDTNPIFMFSNSLEPRNPPQPWPSIDNDAELKTEVERCLELQATYNTVVRRAQLAQRICELGKEELINCDKLVHEQHLQHQGWMAVIANLEDITYELQERCNEFDKVFKDHIERREEYKEYLESFADDLDRLAQIPILPPLLQGAEDQPFHGFDNVYDETDESLSGSNPEKASSSNETKKQDRVVSDTSMESTSGDAVKSDEQPEEMNDSNQKFSRSLLQWITSNEKRKTLKRMAENCTRELDVFDDKVIETLREEIEKTIETAKREDMKEIKGLEERLQGLEALKRDAKKLVAEQSDLAQALQMNQNSASRAGDATILPDLCAPHRNQFNQMMKNHKKLRDIRSRCDRAKDELCKNLLQRLKFVIHIENKMCDIDSKLLFYHGCLRRLQKHLNIIEQIHQAPCVYVQAVTEVVRRKIFSTAFLVWASNLACHLLAIYNEEVMRRTEFRDSFYGHFLNSLFPGIDDFPPKFATEAPSIFDSNLPQLTKNDLNELSKHLPEITKENQLPNLSAIIDFFSSRSSNQETTSTDENINPSNKKLLNVFAQIRDYEKGFESETDTEEYEKINQMSIDNKKPVHSICVGTIQPEYCDMATNMSIVLKNDVEMVTDENMFTGLEVNRLKQLLMTMYRISQESISLLKQQLISLKSDLTKENQDIRSQLDCLIKAYEDLKVETKNNERELIQRFTVDHELELNDLTKKLFSKEDEISTLECQLQKSEEEFSSERVQFEMRINELEEKLEEFEKKIAQQSSEKDATIKALKDNHRSEIESLRCKFKLLKSMDSQQAVESLNASDKSEKIEKSAHEAIVKEMQAKFEDELKKAVKETIEKERSAIKLSESTSKQWSMMASSPSKSPKDSQEIYKRILEEKERQLEQMREREQFLVKESYRYKEIIQSLTDVELNESQVSLYKEKMEALQNEKRKLEKDLEKERAKRLKLHNLMQGAGSGGVTVNSCSNNDIVLVVWSSAHEQYTIVQDSSVLYFLHADSYEPLGLTVVPPNSCPRVSFCIGRVVDKEYCHAKKDENRYKVSKGTKFYRVTVVPRPSPSGQMERSVSERKKIRRSTDSQSDSSKSMKLERQPSNLISSFAQTETHTDTIMVTDNAPLPSNDMVDSGVGSQHKPASKEATVAMDEDEDISLTCEERPTFKSSEEKDIVLATGDDVEKPLSGRNDDDDDDKKDDEAPVLIKECELASLDDSDEYRSLEGKDEDGDTEL